MNTVRGFVNIDYIGINMKFTRIFLWYCLSRGVEPNSRQCQNLFKREVITKCYAMYKYVKNPIGGIITFAMLHIGTRVKTNLNKLSLKCVCVEML